MIYLLSTCQWSDDRLRDYKQDNGYKLFMCNHISDVKMYKTDTLGYMYVHANCIPETRQSADRYNTWVLMDSTGYLKSGGCTCVADDGSCKHVVALLFALSYFVSRHTDRHTLVGTDTICAWDKPKQETRPSKIAELEYFSKKSDMKHTFNPVKQRETHASKRDLQLKVYDLCKGSSAGFLKLVDPPSDESESDEETPEYFSDMLRGFSDSDDIMEYLHNKHDNTYIYNVEQGTIGQRDNPEWQKHRKCRITASVISNIMKCNFDQLSSNHYLVKNCLGTSISFRSDATEFGIKMEKVAKTQYFDMFKAQHKKCSFKECGLFVSKASPFLGASPDGVVKCKCCGTRLVEIKCTFKYADKTPMEVANLQTYHVQNINGEIKLKPSSPWYYQIQTQLGVCGRDICDFVLFTSKAISVETVKFDPDFYKQIVDRSHAFFDIVFQNYFN
ncbi:uncharacterized protein LOC134695595 [Mytilus trossulus]|uniref:uncharacterized protein LOC134695595 n=1 Tax=Mytilus trossulus TaxID=6551 RepID=UPI0030070109